MAAAKGNDYARKYTLEDAVAIFEKGLEYVKDTDDCLSIHDIILFLEIPTSTFKWLYNQHEVLASIKRDYHTVLLSRINKIAFADEAPMAAAIFRMKNLGETDQQNINVTSNGKSLPDWMDES